MKETTLTLHTGFEIGQVDERVFGGFLEHMGRAFFQRRIIAGITMTGMAGQ